MVAYIRVALAVLLLSSTATAAAAPAAAASASNSNVACDEQLSKLQHRLERKQSQWTVATEKLQDELGLCLATKMACETRETMCKRQLGTFDNADVISPAETIQDLQTRLKECQQTLELKIATVTDLESQNLSLESKVGNLETKLSLEQEAAQHTATTLQEDLRVMRAEKDSCQSAWQSRTHKVTTLQQEMNDLRLQLETDQELSRQRTRELTEQHQQELEALQAKAQSTVSETRGEMAAMREQHAQETIRIRNESAIQMEDEMERRAAKWQADRQALDRTVRELRDKNSATERLLQTVKDDLFFVRRELFDLQETFVRGPDLQRRLRQQRWRSWKQWVLRQWQRLVRLLDESLVRPVKRMWIRVLAAYKQYVEPVWRSVQDTVEPVWKSIRAATLSAWKLCAEFYQKWSPIVRQHVIENWRKLSKHAASTWKFFAAFYQKWSPIVRRHVVASWRKFLKHVESTRRAIWQRLALWYTQLSECVLSASTRVLMYAKSAWHQASQRAIGAWHQRASWSEISESIALVGRNVHFVAKGLRIELALVSRGLRIELGEWLHSLFVRTRQKLQPHFQVFSEKYQHHVQPHLKSLAEELSQLYQDRVKPLFPTLVEGYRHSDIFVARLVQQHVEPHLTAMAEGYHRSQVATANALGSVTDLALEYSRIRRYPTLLTRSLEWVKLHTMELVYYGEWLLLLTIAFILFRPRRKNVSVFSRAFPSSKNNKKPKKIQPDNVSSR